GGYAYIRRPEPLVFPFEQIDYLRPVSSTVRFNRICPDDIQTRVRMDDLIPEFSGKKLAFINQHSRGRSCTRLQQIAHNAEVVQMPVFERLRIFYVCPVFTPARSGL